MLTNSQDRKSLRWIFAIIVLAATLTMSAGSSLPARPAQIQSKVAPRPQTSATAQPKSKVSPAPQTKVTAVQISIAKTLGTKNAPIQFEVFSDFQCPACRSFFLSASHRLVEDYCSAGKVYLIHHDFPMPIPSHVHSEEAARWANAAAAIGKFHEVESALYSHQDSWGASGKIDEVLADVLSPTDLKRVRALVDDTEVRAAIQHDKDLGDANNVVLLGTPSIFVTHNSHRDQLNSSGASYNLLKPYLDYLLQH
jgi:protein-disulfide isomerase